MAWQIDPNTGQNTWYPDPIFQPGGQPQDSGENPMNPDPGYWPVQQAPAIQQQQIAAMRPGLAQNLLGPTGMPQGTAGLAMGGSQQQAPQGTAGLALGAPATAKTTATPRKETAAPPSPGTLSVKMPDGSVQTFQGITEALNQALTAGGKPLDTNGNEMPVSQSGGGWLVKGLPLNVIFGQGFQPGQTDALANNKSTPYVPPGGTGVPTGAIDPTDAINGATGGSDTLPPVPQIGRTNLPENPQINPLFTPDENNNWQQILAGGQQNLGGLFDQLQSQVPTMQAAQINQSGIPQPQAQQVGSNSALDFLLSGQGYDPKTLALMRGQATDTATRNALSQRSSANMAAQRAGLQDSGVGMAQQGQINRRLGDTINQSQNQISLNNANTGMENLRQAAPLELQRGTTNAQSANQMAIDNAARLFAGMQQNVANSQQANQTNTTNQNAMVQNRANTVGGYTAGQYGNFGNASTDRANQADFANTTNTINRNLNQANLNRGQDIFNTTTGENRYNNIPSWINALSGVPSGANTAASSANLLGFSNPNFIAANGYQNLGTSLINAATAKK